MTATSSLSKQLVTQTDPSMMLISPHVALLSMFATTAFVVRIDDDHLSQIGHTHPDAFGGRHNGLWTSGPFRTDFDRGYHLVRGRVDAGDRAVVVIGDPDRRVGDGDAFRAQPGRDLGDDSATGQLNAPHNAAVGVGNPCRAMPDVESEPDARHRNLLHHAVRGRVDAVQHVLLGHHDPDHVVGDETAVDMSAAVANRDGRGRLDPRSRRLREDRGNVDRNASGGDSLGRSDLGAPLGIDPPHGVVALVGDPHNIVLDREADRIRSDIERRGQFVRGSTDLRDSVGAVRRQPHIRRIGRQTPRVVTDVELGGDAVGDRVEMSEQPRERKASWMSWRRS